MGMPGSGKTTVGKKLAAKLGLEFIDLDNYIERSSGKKVSELFSAEGESAFRLMEKKCLEEIISSRENFLLSLGGGTPCFFDNLEKINAAGISVYIELPAEALVSRLEQGAGERPMFAGLNREEILKKVNSLLEERKKFYSSARFSISGINLDCNQLAGMLVS